MDRRRLNVAISRAHTQTIVLLGEPLGRRDSLVWHFRQVLRQLHAPFFDTYQTDIVGSLSSLSEYPESEPEAEAALDE